VLLEVPLAVRKSLIDLTPRKHLVRVLLTLDPEDLAFIADSLDPVVRSATAGRLESEDRLAFDQATKYADASVGRYMTREVVAVPDTAQIQQALAHLRALGKLPPQTDRDFVIDVRNVLRGALTLPALLLTDPSLP
jgi:Mg/Co/Ni transporter MgtE